MATFTELLANLDRSPQVRGRQFEQICQWYLRHDPLYRAKLEDVWLWDEWPDRDGRDLGIDLVAKAKERGVKLHLPVDFVTADKFAAETPSNHLAVQHE